jgi:hypothetical protein
MFTVGLLLIIYYSKKQSVTRYEKELKLLRKLQISGQLDKKSFFHIKNRLKVEKISQQQKDILENMFRNEEIDSNIHANEKCSMTIPK